MGASVAQLGRRRTWSAVVVGSRLTVAVKFFLSKIFPFTLDITIYKCLANTRVSSELL